MTIDMTKTIEPKSDQLNADDLIAGPMTITITGVKNVGGDQPIAMFFDGDNGKPFKPCKSMRRVMVKAWGKDGTQYAGKSMTLFNDPNVKFGGSRVGGIRISHMSHIKQSFSMLLTTSRSMRGSYAVKKLELPIDEGISENEVSLECAQKAASCGLKSYQEWFLDQTNECRIFLTEYGHHNKLKKQAGEVDHIIDAESEVLDAVKKAGFPGAELDRPEQ